MTAIIWYQTPYLISNRDILFISFALGNDVSIHCVVGFPTLLALGGLIDLGKGTFVCFELDRTPLLPLDPSVNGLFEDIVFDNSTPTTPHGVATNIKPDPSLLHYTSSEGCTLSSSSTSYSDSIKSHDEFSKGNVSQELEYILR